MSTFDPKILEMMQYGFESGTEGAFEEKLAKFKPKAKHIKRFRKELGLTGDADEGIVNYVREGLFGRSADTKKIYRDEIKALRRERKAARKKFKADSVGSPTYDTTKKAYKDAKRELRRAKEITKSDRPSTLQRTLAFTGAGAIPVLAGGLGATGGYLAGK